MVTILFPDESSTLHSGVCDSQEVVVERMNKGGGEEEGRAAALPPGPLGDPGIFVPTSFALKKRT